MSVSTIEAYVLYFTGMVVGSMVTLAMQLHGARMKRYAYDLYAGLPEEYQ